MNNGLNRKRWFVAGAAVLVQLCLGSIYAWSVFLTPLMEEFKWSRVEVSLTFTIILVSYALAMIIGGRLQERVGINRVVITGGVLLGLGYALASLVNTLEGLYLTYGLLGGLGVGLGYGGPISACLKWFPDKRGLATGLAVAGFGAGALVFAPLATTLIMGWGWRKAFLTLGISLILIIIFGSRFLTEPPTDWSPENFGPNKTDNMDTSHNFTWKEMLSTFQFWKLWLMFSLSTSAGLMIIGHLAPIMTEKGFTPQISALAIGILAVFNGIGRILWGGISDCLGRENTLKLIFCLFGLVLFSFSYSNFMLWVLISAAVLGLCFGGVLSLFPTIIADYFGTKHIATNYALLFTGYGIAGIAGPHLGAGLHELSNNYSLALITAVFLSFMALIASFSIGTSKKVIKTEALRTS